MCIFDIYLAIRLIEYIYCASIKHQPPLIASTNCLRRNVTEQIIKHYPESKNICEIGSGFGGLARAVAKKTKDLKPAHVIDLSKHGYTIYKRIKYPHKLFIYEFK
jgi:hypothetical protein